MQTRSIRLKIFQKPMFNSQNGWCNHKGDGKLYFYSYGRYALVNGLKIIPSGSSVLLPSFICDEVVYELLRWGFRVGYYSVDENLEPNFRGVSQSGWSAIIAVNYFGFPCNLDQFRNYFGSSAVLVEDNCHGLFSRDERGSELGFRADLGIFSVRKTIPIRSGAVLYQSSRVSHFKNIPIYEAIDKLDLLYSIRSSMSGFLARVGCEEALDSAYHGAKSIFQRKVEKPETYHFDAPQEPSSGFIERLKHIDVEKEVSRRRHLFKMTRDLISAVGGVPVFPRLNEGVSPFSCPFRVYDSKAVDYLVKMGLKPQRWPKLPINIGKTPEHYQNLYFIDFIW